MKRSRVLSMFLALALAVSATAVSVLPETLETASVRTTGNPGLRFCSTVPTSVAQSADVAEYGTILIPQECIENQEDFVIGATLSGKTVAKVPARYTYKIEGDTLTYTAVLIDISPKNFTRSIAARSYITYKNGQTVYSDTYTARDVYTVAKGALELGGIDEQETVYLEEVVRYVEGMTVPITFTKPYENVKVPVTIEGEGYTATFTWVSTGNMPFNEEKFVSGTSYKATIEIRSDVAFSPNDKVTINGEAADVVFSQDYKLMTVVTKEYDGRDWGYSPFV